MIYKKEDIDMSLVTCDYEEEEGYIYITDEYTNNILKLAGYSDISDDDFRDLCGDEIFVDKLDPYALKSPEYSYWYARDVLKGKFELGEPIITANALYSYRYARDVLKGRFELGEPIITANARYSYMYARDVLKGRFELGEQIIATDSYFSMVYARDVLKGRFELGEQAITTVQLYNQEYKQLIGITI